MANCPNCGSGHITLKRETNVNWGRATAGWALFGVVGGAIGAVTGEDRNVNACLDCGTSWKAEDLYKILKLIKSSTNIRIDLSEEEDRFYMNSFIAEIGPYLEAVSIAEKKAEKLIRVTKQKIDENLTPESAGCFIILFIFVTGHTVIFSSFLSFILTTTILLVIYVCFAFIYSKVHKGDKKQDPEMIRANIDADKIRKEAQDNLRRAIREFEKTA